MPQIVSVYPPISRLSIAAPAVGRYAARESSGKEGSGKNGAGSPLRRCLTTLARQCHGELFCGQLPEREILTGAGPVTVPKVRSPTEVKATFRWWDNVGARNLTIMGRAEPKKQNEQLEFSLFLS